MKAVWFVMIDNPLQVIAFETREQVEASLRISYSHREEVPVLKHSDNVRAADIYYKGEQIGRVELLPIFDKPTHI